MATHNVFSRLVHKYVPDFYSRNGKGLVRCIFHQEKTASLSIDLRREVFHCFGCGVGGGNRKFAELVGEPWHQARAIHKNNYRREAHEAFKAEFLAWYREGMIVLTDAYRELLSQREVTDIAVRQSQRCPHFYTAHEIDNWQREYNRLTQQIDSLESHLDLLTYKKFEGECFSLFVRARKIGKNKNAEWVQFGFSNTRGITE